MPRSASRLARLVPAGLLSLLFMATAGAAPAAPTADDIIAHNVAARGGAARLKALATLRRSGRLLLPGSNLELKVVEWQSRGGEYREDVTLQGLTAIEAYDGHEAWQVQPFAGRKDPARMSADEAKALALAADLELPFVDYQAKGHTVEYLGTEDVDGTPAHMVRVHLKWGDAATYWLDPDTWMVIRELDRQTVRGAEQQTETDYSEYEQVAGVWVPMAEEQGAKGSDSSQRQKTVYESAEANGSVPAGHYAFPAPRPRAVAEVRP